MAINCKVKPVNAIEADDPGYCMSLTSSMFGFDKLEEQLEEEEGERCEREEEEGKRVFQEYIKQNQHEQEVTSDECVEEASPERVINVIDVGGPNEAAHERCDDSENEDVHINRLARKTLRRPEDPSWKGIDDAIEEHIAMMNEESAGLRNVPGLMTQIRG